MIRADINEEFVVTATLLNESTGSVVTGETINYRLLKQPGDIELSPTVSGIMVESSEVPGIYKTILSIPESGDFILYTYMDGYSPAGQEIRINEENIYELVKQNRHYNISVEDVVRTNTSPTASQTIRNVGLDKTDYILTKIKPNSSDDWSDPTTVSGIVYAWYRNLNDNVPYRMEGEGI